MPPAGSSHSFRDHRTAARDEGIPERQSRKLIVCSTLGALVRANALAAESAHRVAGVASFILLADIGDQRLRTLHLNFEGGDQRVFRVNDNVSRFPLKFKTNRKLHFVLSDFSEK
jgi:hypothetical protein